MSSVSDHIQLMKSQEKPYDSVFNKGNGYTSTIQPLNTTKGHLLLKLHRYRITPNF